MATAGPTVTQQVTAASGKVRRSWGGEKGVVRGFSFDVAGMDSKQEQALLSKLRQNPAVEFVQPDYRRYVTGSAGEAAEAGAGAGRDAGPQ